MNALTPSPLWNQLLALGRTAPHRLTQKQFFTPSDYGRGRIDIQPHFADTAARRVPEQIRANAGMPLRALWQPISPSLAGQGHLLAQSLACCPFSGTPHLLLLDRTGAAVAGYIEGDAWVPEDLRGRGLGAELFLAHAVLHGKGRLGGYCYSPAGYAAATAAHRLAVTTALIHQVAVPDGVMEAYPGLREQIRQALDQTGPAMAEAGGPDDDTDGSADADDGPMP